MRAHEWAKSLFVTVFSIPIDAFLPRFYKTYASQTMSPKAHKGQEYNISKSLP
jgi:hypothetical protein